MDSFSRCLTSSGEKRYIEVKSSGAKTSRVRFYLSENEMIKGYCRRCSG
ncbi:MAG: hypothetical protein DRR42_26430 [Gammaproteobacteria bacterium]|nr:MAG: hypothetical protein DRR42_26430 [Gammaproteobacteria bacterium]